jgi:hypothetical protein
MNTSTNIEPTINNLGNRRIAASRNLLSLIDSAIRAVEPKPSWLESAPTTAAVCRVIDATAKHPGHANKLPLEVFTQFDPFAASYAGVSLQKNLGCVVQFNPDTSKALIEVGSRLVEDSTLITDDEKTHLLDIQGKMEKLRAELSKFSNAAATAEFHNQSHRRIVETLQNGALPEKNIRLMDSIHQEYSANRAALSEVLLDHFHQAFPLAIKAHAKALEIIREQMAFLEAKEREESTVFALPWKPTLAWQACATAQMRLHPDKLKVAASSDSPSTPREMLEGIIEL